MYKGKNGGWMTQSLFYDRWVNLIEANRYAKPVFTFDTDRVGLINCKKTFVELGDPTGYEWAMKYLEDYDHWLCLMKRPWFSEQVEIWRNELLAKIKAAAIKRIQEISTGENAATALAAAKYVAERGWDKDGAGRPTREKVKGELKKLSQDAQQTEDDYARIGLTVIEGGKK